MTSRPPSSADAPARRRWRAAAARLADVSPALAERFAALTAPFVGRVDARRFDAWADAGLRLRAEAGWRGERLAHALLSSAGTALPRLAADEVGRWAALALRCGGELDEATFLRALPTAIAGWDDGTRAAWFDAALSLPPRLALVAYRDLPDALDRLAAESRPVVLAAWQAAAADGAAAELCELTPLVGALV